MKIEINEHREIVIKDLFLGVNLETASGETLAICMRDSGFEFSYGGKHYSAKEDKLECTGCAKDCGMNYCNENGCIERKRHLVPNDLSLPTANE